MQAQPFLRRNTMVEAMLVEDESVVMRWVASNGHDSWITASGLVVRNERTAMHAPLGSWVVLCDGRFHVLDEREFDANYEAVGKQRNSAMASSSSAIGSPT